MSKTTKKAGITGKYGARYGSTLRKTIKSIEESQHKKYLCTACGKLAVKRKCVGIWKCKRCSHTFAGAAYAPISTPGKTYSALMKSMQKK